MIFAGCCSRFPLCCCSAGRRSRPSTGMPISTGLVYRWISGSGMKAGTSATFRKRVKCWEVFFQSTIPAGKQAPAAPAADRSEERRVGKEGGARRETDQDDEHG